MTENLYLNGLSPTLKIMRLSRYGWRYFMKQIKEPKMSNAMYQICIVVAQNEGISQDGVSKTLKMDKSSVAKIVTKAVKDGYLSRQENMADRRQYRLSVTESGMVCVAEMIQALENWQAELLSHISEEDHQEFNRILELIYQQAEILDAA